MRKASTILTWIGAVLSTIFYIARGCMGIFPAPQSINPYSYETETTAVWITPTWAWVIIVILIVLAFASAIYREIALRNGKKVLGGVLTLIFASRVGGVLTFCIPDYQLY